MPVSSSLLAVFNSINRYSACNEFSFKCKSYRAGQTGCNYPWHPEEMTANLTLTLKSQTALAAVPLFVQEKCRAETKKFA